jgi:hypothetical protein
MVCDQLHRHEMSLRRDRKAHRHDMRNRAPIGRGETSDALMATKRRWPSDDMIAFTLSSAGAERRSFYEMSARETQFFRDFFRAD